MDIDRLQLLAQSSTSRLDIIKAGYRSIFAHSDLHRIGYTIRVWFKLSNQRTLYEYNPRLSKLPRITADTYERQAAIHLALGLNLCPPGHIWVDLDGPGLFDAMYLQEHQEGLQ